MKKLALSKQTGFSLVSAMFILLVLALGAGYIVSTANMTSSMTHLQLKSHQAYFAAVSGAEWALQQAINNGTCTGSSTFNLTQEALKGFSVTVTCQARTFTEGSNNYETYDINSKSHYGSLGDFDYTTREIGVKAVRGI